MHLFRRYRAETEDPVNNGFKLPNFYESYSSSLSSSTFRNLQSFFRRNEIQLKYV